jgi:hypothetical protein
MKRRASVLFAFILCAVNALAATTETIYTAGILVNPVSGTVMADTGVMVESYKAGTFAVTAGATGLFAQIERRNAANDANIWAFPIGVVAGGMTYVRLPNIAVDSGERLRITVVTTIAAGSAAGIIDLSAGAQ